MKNFFLLPSLGTQNQLKYIKISQQLFSPKIVRFINKYLYKFNLFGAILNRYDNSVSFYSSKKDKSLYKDYAKDAVFVNFGSGAFNHFKWINFDLPGQSEYYKKFLGCENINFKPIDLCVDNLQIPLNDNSCDLIYCSHTLEHIEEKKGLHFIKECKRILKQNAIMRVALPNTDNNFLICKIVFDQKEIPDEIKNKIILKAAYEVLSETENLKDEIIIEEVIKSNFITSVFVSNIFKNFNNIGKFKINNPGRHITYYSHYKLSNISQQLGFSYYIPMYKGSTLAEPFKNTEVFDTTEPQWSIYGEFIK